MSYTSFRYDRHAVQIPPAGNRTDVQVTVDVTNTGGKEGDEVAQLYVRQDVSSVETPNR